MKTKLIVVVVWLVVVLVGLFFGGDSDVKYAPPNGLGEPDVIAVFKDSTKVSIPRPVWDGGYVNKSQYREVK